MSNIRRAMRLLELLAAHPEGVRLSDLAQSLGLNRAIPHRLLAELVDIGYVRQNPDTERYAASFKLGALGLQQLETAGINRWSGQALAALASETQELVRLAVATDGTLRWVAKAQGSNSDLIVDSVSGAEVVLYATASGKAWLSTLPDEEIERILQRDGLVAQTSRTETDPKRLLAEIADTRRSGYAIVLEEMDIGINAIASPVVPTPGHAAVATVSVAGPSVRLSRETLVSFAPGVKETAETLAGQWDVFVHLAGQPGSEA